MPDAPPQPWADKRQVVPGGEIVKQDLPSALLKDTRKISVCTPSGYSKNAPPYDLLVIFDGDTFIETVPTPTTLDNLISEKSIAPSVALIVGNAKGMRGTELPCNPTFAEISEFRADSLGAPELQCDARSAESHHRRLQLRRTRRDLCRLSTSRNLRQRAFAIRLLLVDSAARPNETRHFRSGR